jgi:predicted patatin/cPLA2 family phospholipase
MMNLIGKIKKYKKIKNRVYKEEKKGFFFFFIKKNELNIKKLKKIIFPRGVSTQSN